MNIDRGLAVAASIAIGFITGAWCARRYDDKPATTPPPPPFDEWESIEGSLRAISVLFGPEIIYRITATGIQIRCRSCHRFNRIGKGLKGARCSACKTPILIEQKAQA